MPAPELARAAWKRTAGNGYRYGVQFVDGGDLRFNAQQDEEKSTVMLTVTGTPNELELHYSQPDPSHVVFEGEPLRVVLRKTEAPPSVLLSRGFHWVNEPQLLHSRSEGLRSPRRPAGSKARDG